MLVQFLVFQNLKIGKSSEYEQVGLILRYTMTYWKENRNKIIALLIHNSVYMINYNCISQFFNQINWLTKYWSILSILFKSYSPENVLHMQNVIYPEIYFWILYQYTWVEQYLHILRYSFFTYIPAFITSLTTMLTISNYVLNEERINEKNESCV